MNISNVSEKLTQRADLILLPSVLHIGLGKLKQIVAGWWYVLFPDKEIELLASERAAVCNPCPHNIGAKCGLCGCPLAAKMRSPDSTCPDGRWSR